MRTLYWICTVAFLSICGMFAFTVEGVPLGTGALVWADEFNGNSLDATRWSVNQPGRWGDAMNTPAAVSVDGGSLKITAYTDPSSGRHYSAVVGTQDHYLPTFGYFESRIKFNDAPGEWSAFWIQSPANANNFSTTPAPGTEVDVAEHRVVDESGTNISGQVNSALHWDGYGPSAKYQQSLSNPMAGMANNTWHTYGLLWTPLEYTFYLDGQAIWTSTTALSSTPEFLLLSSLVQNNTWAGNIPSGGYGPLEASTTGMAVDYVHVFALPEPGMMGLAAGLVLMLRRRVRGD